MSWNELIAIGQEAQAIARDNRERPIVDCPVCGQRLDRLGDVLNCPLGHFRQRGTQRRPESY